MRANGSNTMDILERLRERHLDPDAGNPSTADYAFLLGIAMALAQTLSDKEKVEGKSKIGRASCRERVLRLV